MVLESHIPGRPKVPEPEQLVRLARSIRHPDVIRTGITTTVSGDWALLVVIQPNTEVPIKKVEREAGDFPVIYINDNNRGTIARPAYPLEGE